MDVTYLSPTETKIGEKLDFESTFEENFEDNKGEMDKQSPLYHILEKQAKELEEIGRRMTLELQTSYIKQKNEQNNEEDCRECKEKSELIHTLRARIDELENDARVKDQDIKKLQKDVRSLFDVIVKKGQQPIEKTNIVPAKITITTEIDGTINEVEEEEEEEEMYYNDNIKDSYSDSAIDLFTDDDDYSSTNGGSVRSDDDDYVGRPSEWLDVSHSYRQRPKVDKKNLDRWNSKMASNGLLPIRLVGKVDAEKEKKYQTHRKGYSTSAIWLKTYENTRKKLEQQSQDEKFKLPSFKFSFGSSTVDDEKKESKGIPAPISLKSSVSTSVSELTTCSVTTTSLASNTLKPYEMFHKEQLKNNNTFNNNSSRLLSPHK